MRGKKPDPTSAKRFFIYSTPRSGSAWLANFLTYGGSFCQHEPLANGGVYFPNYPVSGAIDTGAAFIGYTPPEGTEIFHLARNRAEVDASLRRIGLVPYDLSAYKTGFQYRDLFDLSYLEYLWTVVVGNAFDRARAEMLMEMNVQRSVGCIATRLLRRIA